MKVKYILEKNEDDQLTIGEYSVLDKKDLMMFTLLSEQSYEGAAIQEAIAKGKDDLITALRTIDLYPQGGYRDTLVDLVKDLYGPDGQALMEVVIDDADQLSEQAKERELLEDLEEIIEDDTEEFDELLKGDEEIPNIKASIRVADEETANVESTDGEGDILA